MSVYEMLLSAAIGMGTGILSGWLSGVIVTRYYRSLDQKQEQRVLHIKYLEDTAAHLLRVLNELDLLTHKDGPADYENLLREIGIIQISRGKLDDSDPTAALILEKNDMLSEIEHDLKENRLDLQQASLRLIKLSVRPDGRDRRLSKTKFVTASKKPKDCRSRKAAVLKKQHPILLQTPCKSPEWKFPARRFPHRR